MTQTDAEVFAAAMGEDGLTFRLEDGRSLDEVADEHGAEPVYGYTHGYKLVFCDDSIVTVTGSVWDLGYEECWCLRGAGHEDDCEASQ